MSPVPVVVHVGCGKLGIGAVIPFLHAAYPDASIVLVQRRGKHWVDVKEGSTCYLENDSGFYRPYRANVVLSAADLNTLSLSHDPAYGDRLVLIDETLSFLGDLLKKIGDPPVTMSCSLGDGQTDLARALQAAKTHWTQLYAFENSVNRAAFGSLSERVRHVVVDRICWDSGVSTDPTRAPGTHRASCEKEFASYWVPAESAIDPATVTRRGADFGLEGAWLRVMQYHGRDELERIVRRKRALVNATHAILTMLCFDVLQRRKMKAREQYLATVDALLSRELPEARSAMDVYIRVRAAEVASKECKKLGSEEWHACFGECVAMARRAMHRFLDTPDRLDRVFKGGKLDRDFLKKTEHINAPLDWFCRWRDKLLPGWRLGRPNEEDVLRLRQFLETAFESAAVLSRDVATPP
jgi:hypothetical protein